MHEALSMSFNLYITLFHTLKTFIDQLFFQVLLKNPFACSYHKMYCKMMKWCMTLVSEQAAWWPTFFLVAFKTDISRELSWKVQRKIIQQLFCWGITLRPLSIYYWSLVDVAKTIQRYMIVKGNTNRLQNNNLGTTLIWIIFNFINHQ